MARVADVRLFWTRSPSSDAQRQVLRTVIGGVETSIDLTPETQEFQVVIASDVAFTFSVDTYDHAGNHTSSETYSSRVGDLEAPLPATLLGHEVVGVRDVVPPPS